MGAWTCPNAECSYDKQMHPGDHCPLCGKSAQEFDYDTVKRLWKQKWAHKKEAAKADTIERVLVRTKRCPRCRSTDVYWASGLPQLWSTWECRNCGYRGPLIIENNKEASKEGKPTREKKAVDEIGEEG